MKKITKILAALAVAAVAVLGFTGCPQQYEEEGKLDLLEPPYLKGNINTGDEFFDLKYVETDVATATVEFVYDAEKIGDWGFGAGVVAFGVVTDKDWTTKYTGATITVGGEAKTTTVGAGSNNHVDGTLISGKTYVITVIGTADTISVKIDEK